MTISEPDVTIRCRRVSSPVGPLTLAGHGETVTHLRMEDQAHPPADAGTWRRDPAAFAHLVEQLDAYFAGEHVAFDVTLDLAGTAFQRSVWAALCHIPYGETRSYAQIAREVGSPKAARAIGLANGRNPVAIVVPCHRVVGADGTLTGYGGGLARKQALLDLERGAVAALAS